MSRSADQPRKDEVEGGDADGVLAEGARLERREHAHRHHHDQRADQEHELQPPLRRDHQIEQPEHGHEHDDEQQGHAGAAAVLVGGVLVQGGGGQANFSE